MRLRGFFYYLPVVATLRTPFLKVKLATCTMASSNEKQSASPSFLKLRLSGVTGDAGKQNDVFVCGEISDCKQHIIYFGGDVQDYTENMEKHRDNKHYTDWNTESTALKIQRKFPASLVFAIKPTRMHLMTFAVYSNFLEANDFGSPKHSPDFGAVKHLSRLYSSIVEKVCCSSSVEDSSVPIKIIGFSKGSVVLNQIVFELPLIKSNVDSSLEQTFLQKVDTFYWLDGGHSGGTENTWVTSDDPLHHLAELNCNIKIHVTPYQVRDPMRKWIGQQQSKFYKKLKALGAKVQSVEHFDMEPPSLENHFRVLEEFQ